DSDDLWDYEATACKAQMVLACVAPHVRMMRELPGDTPGDAFAIPMRALYELGSYHQRLYEIPRVDETGALIWEPLLVEMLSADHTTYWTWLGPARELLVARLHKRCFGGMSSSVLSSYAYGPGVDKTKEHNYLSNIFVLAAFAASPYYNFTFLV